MPLGPCGQPIYARVVSQCDLGGNSYLEVLRAKTLRWKLGADGSVNLGKTRDNTAGPQSAGYVLQLDRALHHLATATSGRDVVAVEHFDDVVVLRDGKLILAEQDKNTSKPSSKVLNDRSRALWRTLQIWLQLRETPEGAHCKRHLLFVNRWVATPLATQLRDRAAQAMPTSDIVAALRAAGAKPGKAKIDALIADVLTRDDAALSGLVETIEIVDADKPATARTILANGLALHPQVDADAIIDGLLGWLTTKVRADWSEGRPALISRHEILLQSHALQEVQKRSRFLPRASDDVPISVDDRRQALTRNFVGHLGRISAEEEDVFQAVDHFLKFSIEKYRLVKGGDVPLAEWTNRSNRLRERWRNIMRRRGREMSSASPSEIGLAVLADTTYDHRENLDGHPCDELYMTSGNYHRLTEEDEIWWDPSFKRGDDSEA